MTMDSITPLPNWGVAPNKERTKNRSKYDSKLVRQEEKEKPDVNSLRLLVEHLQDLDTRIAALESVLYDVVKHNGVPNSEQFGRAISNAKLLIGWKDD